MSRLNAFHHPANVVIIGANGGIGRALVKAYAQMDSVETVTAFSRCKPLPEGANGERAETAQGFYNHKVQFGYIDLENDQSLDQIGIQLDQQDVDLVIVASGLLHAENLFPEKSRRDLSGNTMRKIMQVNAIAPALIAQQLLPHMRKNSKTVFAVISARVGSISDNRLGGWYSYRASKAALNMLLKTLAIEHKRTMPQSIIVGLHPGTVDTGLSKPFQRHVPAEKLFTPAQSAAYLIDVIDELNPQDSGKVFAWDGQEILP